MIDSDGIIDNDIDLRNCPNTTKKTTSVVSCVVCKDLCNDGLAPDCGIFNVLAMEISKSYHKVLIWNFMLGVW